MYAPPSTLTFHHRNHRNQPQPTATNRNQPQATATTCHLRQLLDADMKPKRGGGKPTRTQRKKGQSSLRSSSASDAEAKAELTFIGQVRAYNQQFVDEFATLSKLNRRLAVMETDIQVFGSSVSNMRMVLELTRDAKTLRRRIRDIESRKKQTAFAKRIKPLLSSYRVREAAHEHVATIAVSSTPPVPVGGTLPANEPSAAPLSTAPSIVHEEEYEVGEDYLDTDTLLNERICDSFDRFNVTTRAAEASDTPSSQRHTFLAAPMRCGNSTMNDGKTAAQQQASSSASSSAASASSASSSAAAALASSESADSPDSFLRRLRRMFTPAKVVPHFVQRDECRKCRSEMVRVESEAQLQCPQCSTSMDFLNSTSEALAFGEEVEIPEHVYMRVKHFRGWFSQFRIGAPPVPDHVIIAVDRAFRNIHHNSKVKVLPTPVRDILRDLKLQAYGSQATIITHRLNKQPIAKLTDKEFDIVLWRFDMIQVPFTNNKLENRTNFINFNYCVHKFAQMEGWHHFTPCFPLLKTRDVLEKLDRVFFKICAELQSQRQHASDPQWLFKSSE
jgi:hypothetical protein